MKKYLSPKDWVIPFAAIFLCFIAFCAAHLNRDGDLFFMVANGDYILHHGFPKENPFVIHEGFQIVIQQWIPSVVAYLCYPKMGWFFVVIESILGLYLLTFVLYKFINLHQSRRASLLTACIIASTMLYLFLGKPMLYSMILLLTQMYVCEKRAPWYWLPLIVIAEANIHASFIAFHFVYLMPYIVPGLTKYLKNTANYKYIIAVPFMVLGALINPYGLDGALYLFNSYGDDLKSVGISELNTISITTIWGVLAVLYIMFVFIQTYRIYIKPKRQIDSDKFYIFAGSLLLLILFPQSRNHIFLIIGSIPLISTMIPTGFKGKTPPTKMMWAVAVILALATAIYIPLSPSTLPTGCPNGAKYLKDKNAVLYNTFDEGSYYEMDGIKVFFDSRPELFFKKLNKKADITDDFKIMVVSKNDDKIAEIINKYQFTHFSVYKQSYLYKYMKKNGYKKVANDEKYVLFEAP